MINQQLERVNNYFENRLNNDHWINSYETSKQSALVTAENLINGHFDLRTGAKETDAYFHAVCEQAFHLLTFSKERLQLQSEGVRQYRVDDVQIEMNYSLFSPLVMGFLKPIIKKKVGKIV